MVYAVLLIDCKGSSTSHPEL